MQPIDATTLITKGMPISDNFIIDHLTSGAYHYVMGKWTPNFSTLITAYQNHQTPMWQVAANLQLGAENILEPLLQKYGGDLILRSALSPSNLGTSFGIQVAGFQGNMFNLIPQIQQIASKASSISLVQGSSSFANINFDPSSILKGASGTLPSLSSVDLINTLEVNGLSALKGFL